ncbi:MAG: lipopolysaccharide biosynthesis protein [Rhizobiaceae bacterium]|nr:lipopolysaccharide biosynthesis protein [Rhizobiaceae bacterium]
MRFSAAMTADRLLPKRLALRARPIVSRVDDLLSTEALGGAAGRVTLIAFAVRIANAVIAFVSQVLLARWMGAFEYGIFVLVWVTMIIVGNLSCLGFHTSVIRFVPEYRETGRLAELRGILLTSRLFVLLASSAIAAVGAGVLWQFSHVVESYYVIPFYLGIVCLPMIALSDVLQGIGRANAWAVAALTPTYVIRPVLILVFMAGALLLGWNPDATTAIMAAILATYATTIYQLLNVTTRIDRKVPAGPRAVSLRFWIAVSLPIFLVESFFYLLTQADVLMVGIYMSPHDVAIYFAAVKTLAIAHFVYFAVKAGVAQRYAHLTHDGSAGQLAEFARQTVNWTFWPTLLLALAMLVLGKPLLFLFGPGFDAGYPLLFVLVFGVVARAAVGPAESLLTMTGHQNVCAVAYACTLALNIGLNVLLIPQFGLWGAAIATAAAMCFEAAVLSFIVWRKLGIVMAVFVPVATREGAG